MGRWQRHNCEFNLADWKFWFLRDGTALASETISLVEFNLSVLLYRSLYVCLDEHSFIYGVPQGSILDPFYLLYSLWFQSSRNCL